MLRTLLLRVSLICVGSFLSFKAMAKDYRFSLGLSKITWSDTKVKEAYNTLYKSQGPLMFSFQVDWAYFQDQRFQLSLGSRFGYTKSSGKTALKDATFTSTIEHVRVDPEGNSMITFFPWALLAGGQIFFDPSRIFGFQVQVGLEQLFHEEIRMEGETQSTSTQKTETNPKRTLVRGVNGLFVLELGLPINLVNILPTDESSLAFMSFRDVLMMPWWRYAQKIDGLAFLGKASKGDFGYMEYGVSFVFQ